MNEVNEMNEVFGKLWLWVYIFEGDKIGKYDFEMLLKQDSKVFHSARYFAN